MDYVTMDDVTMGYVTMDYVIDVRVRLTDAVDVRLGHGRRSDQNAHGVDDVLRSCRGRVAKVYALQNRDIRISVVYLYIGERGGNVRYVCVYVCLCGVRCVCMCICVCV